MRAWLVASLRTRFLRDEGGLRLPRYLRPLYLNKQRIRLELSL